RPLGVQDVWPENYSANSVQKVWAAKFAARHPNVVVLDLSSFKCGHDAPTYGLIDSIISSSATPYSALHDIDANQPGGSIKIRVKTYAHSLKLHEERLDDMTAQKDELKFRVEEKRLQLLELKKGQLAARAGPRALARRHPDQVHRRVARAHHDPDLGPDHSARPVPAGRAPRHRLQGQGDRLPGPDRAHLRQGIRQPRAVQPALLPRREP